MASEALVVQHMVQVLRCKLKEVQQQLQKRCDEDSDLRELRRVHNLGVRVSLEIVLDAEPAEEVVAQSQPVPNKVTLLTYGGLARSLPSVLPKVGVGKKMFTSSEVVQALHEAGFTSFNPKYVSQILSSGKLSGVKKMKRKIKTGKGPGTNVYQLNGTPIRLI